MLSSLGSDDSSNQFEEVESCSELSDVDLERPSTSKKKTLHSVMPLSVGVEFASYAELEQSVLAYEKKNFCIFYKRDCSTIDQCRKRGISRLLNADLKYYRLRYSCIHGGKNFKSLTRGIRKSSTFQKQCPAMMFFICSSDGKKLVLRKMVDKHNHICSKKLYDFLPRVRAMTANEKSQVKNLLALGANKKLIAQKAFSKSKKQILLKDLSNVMSRKSGQNNLKNTIEKLEKEFGAECHVLEENREMKGLFFATTEMKQSMLAYPEFVGIDGTFKLLDIRAPVYLMVVEDSEGNTEIVAVCILMNEDAESMIWFLRTFKEVHPSWSSTKCIMADKDLLERRIIKEEFPSANVLICIFHAQRTFNREVSCEKLPITPEQRDTAKDLFRKMLYSSTETEYMRYYEESKKLPSAILNYFNKNWHDIRNEWTLSINFMQSTFLNTTNNRIESLNAKIKSVVKLYSTLEEFIGSFFALVACLNSERDFKAAYTYQKSLVIPYEKNSAEWSYCQYLTRYAFDFVSAELKCYRRGKLTYTERDDDHFEFRLAGSTIIASEKSCECPSFMSMALPCRLLSIHYRSLHYVQLLLKVFFIFLFFSSSHVFVVKNLSGCDLYDPSICSRRWTREYFCNTQRVFSDETIDDENIPSVTVSSKLSKRYVSTENQRYRIMRDITSELNKLGSEVTGNIFLGRVKLLEKIRKAWSENREFQSSPISMEEVSGFSTSTPVSSSLPCDFNFDDGFNLGSSKDLLFHEIDVNQNTVKGRNDDDNVSGVEYDRTGSVENENSSLSAMDPNGNACLVGVNRNRSERNRDLENLTVPCALKRRGRPKGSEKTVIGLRKKRRVPAGIKQRPFFKLSINERALVILKWVVDDKIAYSAVYHGKHIQEESVESNPDAVCDSIIDDDINILSMKKYFSGDAWRVVEQILECKRKNDVFLCAVCAVDLDTTIDESSSNCKFSIRCDYCVLWYHVGCVGLKKPPKSKLWKCNRC
ncbi:uncharacterized protein [Venturia canescens]|uniref:uncharacterized protein n=1 Tax=Venturia canescens TaxID=32260 RepID=UPI001C9CA7BC|nr:uncharacterized protein LOC122407560 [Venturia canescens]